MDPYKIREDFPITKRLVYLNNAALGPSPIPVLDAINRSTEIKTYGDYYQPSLGEMIENLDNQRRTVGKLLNAKNPEEEIAFLYNTSSGLAAIAEAINWEKGERIILNDLEYTSNSYTYQVLAKKNKLDIDVVKNKKGYLLLDDFEEKISDKTRLLAISHVQFSNGFRTNLKELAKIVHENEAEIIVDGIQSVGAVPLDVKKTDIDYLSAGSQKWILGPFNTGFIYTKAELAENLNPSFIGSISDKNPLNLVHHEYSPGKAIKRFQGSMSENSEILAVAINYLYNIGIENIFNHILSLHNQIIDGLKDFKGVSILSSLKKENRSAILSIKCSNAEKIVQYLRKKKICVSYRIGGIRVSPHCYNSKDEIDTFIEELTKQLRTHL